MLINTGNKQLLPKDWQINKTIEYDLVMCFHNYAENFNSIDVTIAGDIYRFKVVKIYYTPSNKMFGLIAYNENDKDISVVLMTFTIHKQDLFTISYYDVDCGRTINYDDVTNINEFEIKVSELINYERFKNNMTNALLSTIHIPDFEIVKQKGS